MRTDHQPGALQAFHARRRPGCLDIKQWINPTGPLAKVFPKPAAEPPAKG
jgi:hypothetical protein